MGIDKMMQNDYLQNTNYLTLDHKQLILFTMMFML